MMIKKAKFPKHSEFVYGIEPTSMRSYFQTDTLCRLDMDASQMNELMLAMDENVMGARRAIIAKTDLLLQVIGYGVAFQRPQNAAASLLFAVYRRNKRNGEGQLASMDSMGFGGHVEQEDTHCYFGTNVIDVENTLHFSFLREMSEEVKFIWPEDASTTYLAGQVGVVFNAKPEVGYVGNHHMGVVYAVEVPYGTDFELSEEMNDAVGWFTIEQLRERGDVYEPWTAMVIEQLDVLEQRLKEGRVDFTLNGFNKEEQEEHVPLAEVLADVAKN